MGWGKIAKGGWKRPAAESDAGGVNLRQIIYTIVEVVKGGVIRYGKTAWDDAAHVGFWLGVSPDGTARFHVGGPGHALLWDGGTLTITGHVKAVSGELGDLAITGTQTIAAGGKLTWDSGSGQLSPDGITFQAGEKRSATITWAGPADDAATLAAWPHVLLGNYLRIANTGATARDGRTEVVVQSARAALVLLSAFSQLTPNPARVSVTAGDAGAWVELEGDGVALYAPLVLNDWRIMHVGDAAADTDALNRRSGDARYVGKAAGWSGEFRTDEIATVTVVDGQITGLV
jgi:hypothetical protein